MIYGLNDISLGSNEIGKDKKTHELTVVGVIDGVEWLTVSQLTVCAGRPLFANEDWKWYAQTYFSNEK